MIIYRTIKKEEISKCIDLITDSYNGYSFYEIFVEDKKRRFKFLKEIQKVCVKTCYKQQTILVSLQDDKIVPIAILKSPNEPEPTIWNYLCSGGLNVFLAGGIKNTLGWLKMYNESSAACHSISEDSWYLTSLVVANEFKNQGLGSKMLQDGVIPYISQHGGGLLTLITNSESNCNFYKKNGFTEFHNEVLNVNNKKLNNWGYKMNIQANI